MSVRVGGVLRAGVAAGGNTCRAGGPLGADRNGNGRRSRLRRRRGNDGGRRRCGRRGRRRRDGCWCGRRRDGCGRCRRRCGRGRRGRGAFRRSRRGRGLRGRGPEANAHARGRRVRRLDDLGHNRRLLLLVDLQGQRRADRQRLAEHEEGARVSAIAYLRRPPDDHAPISNLRVHDAESTKLGTLKGFQTSRDGLRQAQPAYAHANHRG